MVDKKISALDESTALASTDVFAVVDVGSTITKKITLANTESSLGISGALVTDIANLVTVSGASVTDVNNLVTVSGAGVAVSGALVTDISNLVTVSGAGVVVSGALVSDIANLVTVSGASVVVSGATVTNTAKVSYTKTNVKATINHGGTSGTSRPTGFDSVEWIGTVEPTNAANDDTWIDVT